jgi:hypothetical protein
MTNSTHAILANMALLEERLQCALAMTVEARAALVRGDRNLAIGTLLPAEHDLADASTLLKTVFVLHRAEPLARGGLQ